MEQSGGMNDRIAAGSIAVQEAGIYGLSSLQGLLTLSKKNHRRLSSLASQALSQLFINTLLPQRALIPLYSRPIDDESYTSQNLQQLHLLWYFESILKTMYLDFIRVLEALSHDTILHTKSQALTLMYDLLTAAPEQEKNLLALIVNKLVSFFFFFLSFSFFDNFNRNNREIQKQKLLLKLVIYFLNY